MVLPGSTNDINMRHDRINSVILPYGSIKTVKLLPVIPNQSQPVRCFPLRNNSIYNRYITLFQEEKRTEFRNAHVQLWSSDSTWGS